MYQSWCKLRAVAAVLQRDHDRVRILTLNRPDALNAFTIEAMIELSARLETAAADPAVRAVVLTGAGAAFSSGGDTRFLQHIPAMARFGAVWIKPSWRRWWRRSWPASPPPTSPKACGRWPSAARPASAPPTTRAVLSAVSGRSRRHQCRRW